MIFHHQGGLAPVFNLFWPVIAGYLIGSFPTAYLAVRWKSNVDIRKTGSGNVGTLNSFQVTRSKAVGVTVLIVDVLKGVVAVMVGRMLVPGLPFVGVAFAGAAAVVGHTYPIWLLFKGGRGLATAAGAMGSVSFPLVAAWMAAWGIGFAFTRVVNVASFAASLLMLGLVVLVPDEVIRAVLPEGATTRGLRTFAVMILLVMLTRLIGPLREYLRDRRAKRFPERVEGS
jgi:acyl phosphate:glycerol-3-phosphate acyltransferase